MKITPLIKGLIAGIIMIGVSLLLLETGGATSSKAQYLFYMLYAGAIAWTLLDYYRSPGYSATFGSIFGQGFRCFIIITLVSVLFAGIYASLPEVKQGAIKEFETFVKTDKAYSDKTPQEKEELVKRYKDQFVTGNVSMAIFGSLITGAVFTAAGAGLLLMRRK